MQNGYSWIKVMVHTASNNNTYLITASATYNYIRSYKTETQTKTGIFFFKKN